MKTVIACLLLMCLMPIVCAWVSGYYRHKQFGRVDNKNPRQQNAALAGAGARAVAAQANCWEALAVFTASLVAVGLAGVDLQLIATLCIAVVLLRLVYVASYLADVDALRSLVFLGAYGICIYFFYVALSVA